jgi:hypothetical protein
VLTNPLRELTEEVISEVAMTEEVEETEETGETTGR